jgi:hypothetical protein
MLANCTGCGASNLGISRTDLVLIDGTWYCKKCLSQKGQITCHKCGKRPFFSDEHFKLIDGHYVCTDCMEKMGIIKKYDYIMSAVLSSRPRTVPGPGQPNTRTGNLSALGLLQDLLKSHLEAGEEVKIALAGNAGEGLACSSRHVFVLKSGMATGSITGKKCFKYRWSEISGVEMKEGALYGLIEIQAPGLPSHDAHDISKAKRSENAVTFLAAKKTDFAEALSTLKTHLRA